MTPSALRDLAADVLARHIARILVDGSGVCVVEYPNAPWPCDAVALANAIEPLLAVAEAGEKVLTRWDASPVLDVLPDDLLEPLRAALRELEAAGG